MEKAKDDSGCPFLSDWGFYLKIIPSPGYIL